MIKFVSDIQCSGLELDQSWWTSGHSPPTSLVPRTFLPVGKGAVTAQTLRSASPTTCDAFALLFCYFNDRRAFDAYVRVYWGPLIVVVGPLSAECDVVTDPRPLDLATTKGSDWRIRARVRLDNDANGNVAVIYVRK